MASTLLLDWKGDAEIPIGSRVVTNEVEWLQVALNLRAPEAEGVMVRGANLCEWASQWWQAAGGTCENVHNSIDSLLSISPDLSRDEAKLIIEEINSRGVKVDSQRTLSEILAVIFPDFGLDGFGWNRQHTDVNRFEIAAQWLLWLENQKTIDTSQAKLIEHQAEIWRELGDDSRELFPSTSLEAQRVLKKWLGLCEAKDRASFEKWPPFPDKLPSNWSQQARDFYAQVFTRQIEGEMDSLTKWWNRFELSNATNELRKTAADTIVEVLKQHPQFISGKLVARLEPLVNPLTLSNLHNLKPPIAPPPLPEVKANEAKAVLDWVVQKYLPFRRWQAEHGTGEAHSIILKSAHEFGNWFLDFYADALSGTGVQFLQIHRAGEMRSEQKDELTFWVIADGLGWLDASTLAQRITENNSRLSLSESIPCFSTIPTITSFAKPALRWSAPPDQVAPTSGNLHRNEIEVPGHKEAMNSLENGQAGDLVIWKPLQPDKTYHENADVKILRNQVDGVLSGLAKNIVEAAMSAPDNIKLKIIVTTDHGRLLSSSQRIHTIPLGFTAHGRAAYGTTVPNLEGKEGVYWLNPDIYRCKSHVIIATDEGSFLTNSSEGTKGHSGVEKFPHGGIFPEEVVVPWLSFERDATPITVQIALSGKCRSERVGNAVLSLVNSSNKTLNLEQVEIFYGRQKGTEVSFVENSVLPYSKTEITVQLDIWPNPSQVREMAAMILLRAPDGSAIQSPAQIEIEVEALQIREDILGDLF